MPNPSTALKILAIYLISIVVSRNLSMPDSYIHIIIIASLLFYFLISKISTLSIRMIYLKSGALTLLLISFSLFRISLNKEEHFLSSYVGSDLKVKMKLIDGQPVKGKYCQLLFEVKQIMLDNTKLNCAEKVLGIVEVTDAFRLKNSSEIVYEAQLQPILNDPYPGAFDTESYWEQKGVELSFFAQQNEMICRGEKDKMIFDFAALRTFLASKIESALPEKSASLAIALLLGDKSNINKDVKGDFVKAGAMHLLAVSGLHVGILLFCIQLLFKRIKLLRKKALYLLVSLLILWFYAMLTGASPSVVRACLMFSFLVMGKLMGRDFFSLDILLTSALCMLLFNPNYLFDIGFQLSFSAMISISLFFNSFKNLLSFKTKLLTFVWEGTAISLAAQLGTLPLSLYYFHQFPSYFLLSNFVLLFLSFISMFSGLLFLCSFYIPGVSYLSTLLFKYVFLLLGNSIAFIADLPNALVKGFVLEPHQVIIYYALLVLIYLFLEKRNLKLTISASFLLALLFFQFNLQRNQLLREEQLFLSYNKKLLLIYSKEGVNYFLYDGSSSRAKVDYAAKGYSKYRGGELVLQDFKEKRLCIGEVEIETFEDSLKLNYHGDSFMYPLKQDGKKLIEIHGP